MTITEMHRAFKLGLDKSSALELPSFEPEEIDFWLNWAIRNFVKSRFSGKQTGSGFEQSTKRTIDLSELIEEETLPVIADTVKANSFIANLSDLLEQLWFIVGEEVTISYIKLGQTTTTGKKQGVTQCTALNYRSHLDDPYSEHVFHYEEAKPLRLIYQRYVELITDGKYDVLDYSVRYLRKPAEVSISGTVTDCDLPEIVHDEVVELAVNMVLENIEEPRYQSHTVQLNKVE
jgi:hypothetical protein